MPARNLSNGVFPAVPPHERGPGGDCYLVPLEEFNMWTDRALSVVNEFATADLKMKSHDDLMDLMRGLIEATRTMLTSPSPLDDHGKFPPGERRIFKRIYPRTLEEGVD